MISSERKRTPKLPSSPSRPRSPIRTRSTRSATAAAATKSPSPPKRSPSPPKRSPSPPKRSPSPPKRSPSPPKKKVRDPYATPFWPPSDYSVPAKVIVNSPTPLPGTLAKHKIFIKELRTVLINEKIIDRDNPQFKELLAEQQKYNMRFFRLKPHNIICFVRCDYDPRDKSAPRVFHKGNKEPYYGNYKFTNLLKRNNMDMKWWGQNILYIHKNRF
uniref:Uncharacterized protein n=1 Tax=viral metagenome TaxID=1070528 RepID=A0A6C0LBA4_9ZZZZ